MAEYGLNLWDYWRIIHKRKWIIISIFIVSVLSSQFFGTKTEPVYRSTATINVNSKQPIAEVTGTGVTFWGAGGRNELSTQLELIKSYGIMKEVALKLSLFDEKSSEEKIQAVISSIRKKITVVKQSTTSLVDITATDTDPKVAQALAATVTQVFIDDTWNKRIKEARNTKLFVEKQLAKLDKNSTVIRKKLEAVGINPGERLNVDEDKVDPRARLTQLNMELADLQTRYTENYPGIKNINSEIFDLEEYIKNSGKFEEEKKEEDLYDVYEPVTAVDVERLENELAINQKLYGILRERYEKASILEASKSKGIEIVNPPLLPRVPFSMGQTVNLFFGAIIGLILGLVAALVAESMDTSIGTIEDVEEYLKMPVLGVIPRIELDKKDQQIDYWKNPPPPEEQKKYNKVMGCLITQFQPKSSIAEAYRNLQTYIKFTGLDKNGNCLLFTSAGVEEGKTITSVNCALSMAQMGYKVLLIDADLRRPSVHKVFGIEREMGLSDVVLGTFKLEDAVKGIDDIMMGNIKSSMVLQTYGMENLNILTSGHLPNNPPELLSSNNMAEFIKEVKSKYQVVLFDTAPILPVTDTCLLGSQVDGAILVYEVGRVSRGALRRCKIQIESAHGKPIGVVLNGMRASDMKFGSPFYYYYQKYYGENETAGAKNDPKML